MADLYNAHVDLYDIAFGWDISEEVEWLLDRLGHDCRKVLEPGCGTGRMLEAFARRGVEAVGIDSSSAMVLFAERRLRKGRLPARVVLGDMRDFDLGETFDAAVCPIGTLAHLAPDELTAHLDCMARHLAPGASYLVQLALRDAHSADEALRPSSWEMSRGGTRLQITWATEEIDLERRVRGSGRRPRGRSLRGGAYRHLVDSRDVVDSGRPVRVHAGRQLRRRAAGTTPRRSAQGWTVALAPTDARLRGPGAWHFPERLIA